MDSRHDDGWVAGGGQGSELEGLEELRAAAGDVRLPRGAYEGVLAAAREQSQAEGPVQADAAAVRDAQGVCMLGVRRAAPARGRVRVADIAAAMAAVVLGAWFAGGSLTGWLGGDAGASETSSASVAAHPFALVAYAEGLPQQDGASLALASFATPSSFSEGDGTFSVSTTIDLTCSGDGIQSVTYELDGPSAQMGSAGEDGAGAQASVRFDLLVDNPGEGDSAGSEGTSFSTDYLTLSDDERVTHNVTATFVPSDELLAALGALRGSDPASPEAYRAAMTDVDVLALRQYADLLGETTLKLTATFADGSTQTRSYRIRPVEGFDDVARAYYERVNALDAEDLADAPQLYSIEEVPTA